jgi:hypothetical protein
VTRFFTSLMRLGMSSLSNNDLGRREPYPRYASKSEPSRPMKSTWSRFFSRMIA